MGIADEHGAHCDLPADFFVPTTTGRGGVGLDVVQQGEAVAHTAAVKDRRVERVTGTTLASAADALVQLKLRMPLADLQAAVHHLVRMARQPPVAYIRSSLVRVQHSQPR